MPEAAPDSRTRVQQAVDRVPEGATVEAIAESTGLHANTVRGHLDVLLAAELVRRESADAQGRGRPRWLYRTATRTASPFQALAEALSAQLVRVQDPALADSVADTWARALPHLPAADSPDEAVAEATDALRRLGFEATANPVGNEISVTGCPYADFVDDNPVICHVHTALVGRLLLQTGQPVSIESMDVWGRPGVCVAHLRRPDLVPVRTIHADERGGLSAVEGEVP